MQMRYTHMTFFWGKDSEILFTMWPGTRGGMYALALVVVFALGVLLECLGCRWLESCLSSPRGDGRRRRVVALARTAVYAVRVGGPYLLMLAVMSFNGGVLLVAVAGHAAGFLAFRAGVWGGRGWAEVEEDRSKEDAKPLACC